MKITLFLFFVCLVLHVSINANGQLVGVYRDCCSDELILKKDSSFEHYFRYDLMVRWTVGTWSSNHDTIHLKVTPFIDTVQRANHKNGVYDSLVISADRRSNLGYDSSVFVKDKKGTLQYVGSPTDQDTAIWTRFYFKKDRLFYVKTNGRLFKKRQEEIFPTKKRLVLFQRRHQALLYPNRRFFVKEYTYRKYKAGMVKKPQSISEMQNN